MYYVLAADHLLAAVLERRDCISFNDLNDLRRHIEKSCPGVAVDISSAAIASAIECYPEIFERRLEQVARAANAEHYLRSDYLKQMFTNHIPADIYQKVAATIG